MKSPTNRTAVVAGLSVLAAAILATVGATGGLSAAPKRIAPTVNGVRLPAPDVLMAQKKVSSWPGRAGVPGGMVIALSVSECTWLGGKVEYWSSCEGTLMKCVGSNGREMCIDKIQ